MKFVRFQIIAAYCAMAALCGFAQLCSAQDFTYEKEDKVKLPLAIRGIQEFVDSYYEYRKFGSRSEAVMHWARRERRGDAGKYAAEVSMLRSPDPVCRMHIMFENKKDGVRPPESDLRLVAAVVAMAQKETGCGNPTEIECEISVFQATPLTWGNGTACITFSVRFADEKYCSIRLFLGSKKGGADVVPGYSFRAYKFDASLTDGYTSWLSFWGGSY